MGKYALLSQWCWFVSKVLPVGGRDSPHYIRRGTWYKQSACLSHPAYIFHSALIPGPAMAETIPLSSFTASVQCLVSCHRVKKEKEIVVVLFLPAMTPWGSGLLPVLLWRNCAEVGGRHVPHQSSFCRCCPDEPASNKR